MLDKINDLISWLEDKEILPVATTKVHSWTKDQLEYIAHSDIEKSKEGIKFVLVWIAFGYLMFAGMLLKIGISITDGFLLSGPLLFFVATFFLPSKKTLERILKKLNIIPNFVMLPFIILIWFTYQNGFFSFPLLEYLSVRTAYIPIFIFLSCLIVMIYVITNLFRLALSVGFILGNMVTLGCRRYALYLYKRDKPLTSIMTDVSALSFIVWVVTELL